MSPAWERLAAWLLAVALFSLGGCAGVSATSVTPPAVTDLGCIDVFSRFVSTDWW